MDTNTQAGSSMEEISGELSVTGHYCKIPGCPQSLIPFKYIQLHVKKRHPDNYIGGPIGEISLVLNGTNKDSMIIKLLVAHERIYWVTLTHHANDGQLICGSEMVGEEEEGYYPSRSVSVFVSGFGHEIMLSDNFGRKRKKGDHRLLNDPVTAQELSKMMSAENRIYALAQVIRRSQRKVRQPKSLTDTQLVGEKVVAHRLKGPERRIQRNTLPVFYCVVSTCGINLNPADFVAHLRRMHTDLIVSGKVGEFSLNLRHHNKDELFFRLMEVHHETFLVMVAYWHRNVQLQFGSFMMCIPKNAKYATFFKMSKCQAIVGHTELQTLINNYRVKPFNDKKYAVLTGNEVTEMLNSKGQLKITVKIKVTSYCDTI